MVFKSIIMKKKILALGSAALLTATLFAINSCSSIPNGAKAVKNFDKEKYLGNWFEIARLDFVFEKNLNNTTAEYVLNEDGSIKVINRGYNYIKNKNVASTGKVKFVGDENEGKLKVYAQVVRIYDLSIRIKCTECDNLANSCGCKSDNKTHRTEVSASFLVDDHTSLIKLSYSNYHFDFKYHPSEMFEPIGDYLHSILLIYLNEIKFA